MELIAGVIATAWEELKSVTIPIVNLSVVDFLLGLLVITLIVDILRMLLGLHIHDAESRISENMREPRNANKRRK